MFWTCMLFTEDNIQHLHEIHEALQQMRDSATLGLTQVI
jgi:A-kinase anchor protein 13